MIIVLWIIVVILSIILIVVVVALRRDKHYWIPNEIYYKVLMSRPLSSYYANATQHRCKI